MIGKLTWKLGKALAYPLGRTPVLGSLESVETKAPVVALTFDDGPDPTTTPQVLEILRAHGAKATFFVVGEAAVAQPDVLAQIAAEGHALANHGWSHRSLPPLRYGEQVEEVRRCAEVLRSAGTPWFRPPYGHQSIRSRIAARQAGCRVVTWSGHVADWRRQAADALAGKLREQLVPGAIILLHDAIRVDRGVTPGPDLEPDRSQMLQALDQVLAETRGQFDYTTVPELLALGRARWASWFRYSLSVA